MPTKDDVRDRLAELTRAEVAGAAALVVLLLAAAGLWYWRSLPRTVEVRAVRGAIATTAPASPAPAAPVVVHVAGRVRSPGVYELAAGARLVDALEAAGGALRGADLDAINLAALAVDGTQIYIPRRGEIAAAATGGVSADGRIDINAATAADLETLPRVGEVLAQRIVDYRTANGPFASVDDLLDVSGIGQATLDGFRDLITV
ncbi:MAG: helix-hairpin-helix domain-containing protein [Actinomycetota bacterium]